MTSDTVQIEMLHDAMLIVCAIFAALGLMGAAKITAGAQKRILEKVAEVHALTNSTSEKQLAEIADLKKLVVELTTRAAVKEGIEIGVQQQKDSMK